MNVECPCDICISKNEIGDGVGSSLFARSSLRREFAIRSTAAAAQLATSLTQVALTPSLPPSPPTSPSSLQSPSRSLARSSHWMDEAVEAVLCCYGGPTLSESCMHSRPTNASQVRSELRTSTDRRVRFRLTQESAGAGFGIKSKAIDQSLYYVVRIWRRNCCGPRISTVEESGVAEAHSFSNDASGLGDRIQTD